MKTPVQTLTGRFGLSQQQLADFLSVHRSMLTHIKSGNKLLPDQHFIQLQKLLRIENIRPVKKNTRQAATVSKTILQEIQETNTSLRIQIRLFRRQLQQMQDRWQKCIKSYNFCQLAKKSDIQLSSRQQRWLEELQYQTEQQQIKCDPDQQMLLTLRIASLEAQLAVYNTATVIKNQINKS